MENNTDETIFMEFKEVAHLYIGASIMTEHPNYLKAKIHAANKWAVFAKNEHGADWLPYSNKIKPMLRPLSDLSEGEIIWMFVLRATANGETIDKQCRRTGLAGTFMQIEFEDFTSDYQDIKTLYPEQTKFLLEKGFDLFGLIKSNEAIICLERGKKK